MTTPQPPSGGIFLYTTIAFALDKRKRKCDYDSTAANDTQNSLGESQPSNESAAVPARPQAHAWPNVPGEPDPRVKSKEECLAQAAIGWTLRSGRDGATEPTEPRVCIANWNRQGQFRPEFHPSARSMSAG